MKWKKIADWNLYGDLCPTLAYTFDMCPNENEKRNINRNNRQENACLRWKVIVMTAGVTSDRSSIVKISSIQVWYMYEWTYSLRIYQFILRCVYFNIPIY